MHEYFCSCRLYLTRLCTPSASVSKCPRFQITGSLQGAIGVDGRHAGDLLGVLSSASVRYYGCRVGRSSLLDACDYGLQPWYPHGAGYFAHYHVGYVSAFWVWIVHLGMDCPFTFSIFSHVHIATDAQPRFFFTNVKIAEKDRVHFCMAWQFV